MTRNEVTELIITHKLRKKLTWPQLAESIGMSKEWTTAALMGQMTLTAEQAGKIGTLLDLPQCCSFWTCLPCLFRTVRPEPVEGLPFDRLRANGANSKRTVLGPARRSG